MATTIISRDYFISAAHRLQGHPKCGRLHGHNYRITVNVTLMTRETMIGGMVIDYGRLDAIVKPIVDRLDHRYLVSKDNLSSDDPYALMASELNHAYLLESQYSTAECLAKELYQMIKAELPDGLRLTGVEVEETPKSLALYFEG